MTRHTTYTSVQLRYRLVNFVFFFSENTIVSVSPKKVREKNATKRTLSLWKPRGMKTERMQEDYAGGPDPGK